MAAMVPLVGSWAAASIPASASDSFPDPGFPVVPCSEETVVLTSNAQLDPDCEAYSGGIEITASDVTLDCRGASVVTSATSGSGIRIHAPADQDMSGITVRNCVVSGFTNGIRVKRDDFHDLAAGEEYEHALEDVTLAGNHVSGTRGVGVFIDGYVTDTTITDNTISEAGGSGIYLEAGSADNVITDNQVVDSGFREMGAGGQLETFNGYQFRFWGTGREGISIDGSRRNTVSGNTVEGNSAGGIFLYTNCGEDVNSDPDNYFPRRYGATDNLIADNHLSGGLSGVWVGSRMGESVLAMDCSDTPYYESGITQITLDRAAHNTIRDNVFEDVTYGVRVEDDDTEVTGNSFSGPEDSYAVIVGTPYRTSALGEPVSGTQLIDNESTIAGNQSPYRWAEGETDSTVTGNSALGKEVGMCESESLPRGPFVMVIEYAYEPEGSEVTPAPADLEIPGVGKQAACSEASSTDPVTETPSNEFKFGSLKGNEKKGVATLSVKVPGAGKVGLRRTKAVKPQARTAGAAGTIKLTVRARGGAERKLKRHGRVKVRATVTFTPTGGASKTKSRTVKLVKRTVGHRQPH